MAANKPMHAAKYQDVKELRYPCYIQPKYDGLRGVIEAGKPLSRTWKPLPNKYVQDWVENYKDFLNGMDGEFMVGPPFAEDAYRKSMSGIMSAGGTPDFKYYVFDYVIPLCMQKGRFDFLSERIDLIQRNRPNIMERLVVVPTQLCQNEQELLAYEAVVLAMGAEGVITRDPEGAYKHGRATPISQELVKLKRFLDEEAEIIGFEELHRNENEAMLDAFGLTKRSSHGAGKIPAGMLGAFNVRNAKGQTYNVGMGKGLDMALRQQVWNNRDSYLGRSITVRYVRIGGYDVPRFPGFHGFRAKEDMSDE